MYRQLPDWYEAELGDHDTVVMEDGRFNPPTWKRASEERPLETGPQGPPPPAEEALPDADPGQAAGEARRQTGPSTRRKRPVEEEDDEDENIPPPDGGPNENLEDADQPETENSSDGGSATNLMNVARAAMAVARAAGNAFSARKSPKKAKRSPPPAAAGPVNIARISKKVRSGSGIEVRVPEMNENGRRRYGNATIINIQRVKNEPDLWTFADV
ncbi:MAG: hypothetical protein Q9187_008390 [Circinaria calcarea]